MSNRKAKKIKKNMYRNMAIIMRDATINNKEASK